jgi:transposase-like protein
VKYGTFQGMQRYFCKDCRRKFADNDSLPGMKTPSLDNLAGAELLF